MVIWAFGFCSRYISRKDIFSLFCCLFFIAEASRALQTHWSRLNGAQNIRIDPKQTRMPQKTWAMPQKDGHCPKNMGTAPKNMGTAPKNMGNAPEMVFNDVDGVVNNLRGQCAQRHLPGTDRWRSPARNRWIWVGMDGIS
jgi:hypothetical protein